MDLDAYRDSLYPEGQSLFDQLKNYMLEASEDTISTIFVKNPYFYLPKYEDIKPHHRPSVMLVFFKDHVNIFAQANEKYQSNLPQYQFTEKHTMKINYDQTLDRTLIQIFKESLNSNT